MKKTITRGQAVQMHAVLTNVAFGHFNEEDLEKVMNNYAELGKVAESYESLMKELGKRLYDGYEQEDLQKFNGKIQAAQKFTDIEKRVKAVMSIKEESPELYALLEKQMKVEASLKAKDIEVELEPIDEKDFIKAVLKGKPNFEQGLFALFEPMYVEVEKEKAEEDFSELDELLNE